MTESDDERLDLEERDAYRAHTLFERLPRHYPSSPPVSPKAGDAMTNMLHNCDRDPRRFDPPTARVAQLRFKNRLAVVLRDCDCSQAELAKALEVSRMTVCDWMHGRKSPTLAHLVGIAYYLGVSFDALLGGKR